MGGRQHYLTVKSHLFSDLLLKRPEGRARSVDFLEDPSRKSKTLYELSIPLSSPRIHKLSGSRICVLCRLLSCQQKMKIVREHEKAVSPAQQLRLTLSQGRKLIHGIKQLLLDPGPHIQLLLRHRLIDLPVHPPCPSVSVTHSRA